MRVFALVSALAALLAGCGGRSAQPDHQAEWRDVLRHKKAAYESGATTQQKQVYADSLRAFIQKHPTHSRAREVWQRIQLEFAKDLARLAVTREQLLALQKGMSQLQVSSILGNPFPGWTMTKERSGATLEAWYYRMQGGGLAAVYFRNGKVLAAEESSNAPLGRFGS